MAKRKQLWSFKRETDRSISGFKSSSLTQAERTTPNLSTGLRLRRQLKSTPSLNSIARLKSLSTLTTSTTRWSHPSLAIGTDSKQTFCSNSANSSTWDLSTLQTGYPQKCRTVSWSSIPKLHKIATPRPRNVISNLRESKRLWLSWSSHVSNVR
jgi:hypothetical protein